MIGWSLPDVYSYWHYYTSDYAALSLCGRWFHNRESVVLAKVPLRRFCKACARKLARSQALSQVSP